MPWKPMEGDQFPSLGFLVADWIEDFLAAPDTGDTYKSFKLTTEQVDFLINLYEIDPSTCRRVKQRAVLSRPRGWGKSPFIAAVAIAEALAPVLCDGWDAEGQPVGVPWSSRRTPDVVVAATTEEQTRNAWKPLLEMLSGPVAEYYNLDAMQSFVALPSGGRIYPISASARSIKGRAAVCAILDQTETWVPSNGGVELAATLRANARKLGGLTVETPNAFIIGQGSVAELSEKHWENVKAGKVKKKAERILLYDHRQAPLDTNQDNYDSLIKGLRIAYGDSADWPEGCILHDPPCPPGWAPIDSIAAAFWDTTEDPVQMAGDFLNQHSAASDAWLSAPDLRAIVDTSKVVTEHEPVAIGFDGSEGRQRGIADSTVLIGYSVSQKHLFKIGVWSQPDGPAGEGWKPPELEIEQTLREFIQSHNVVASLADPSAGWAANVRAWEADWGRGLAVKMSPAEPIRYPQRNVSATCEGFAQLRSAIISKQVTYDGSPEITAHFLHARKDPRRTGYVLKKPDNDHDYSKIDCAYGAMYAYRAGLMALGAGVLRKRARRIPRRLY